MRTRRLRPTAPSRAVAPAAATSTDGSDVVADIPPTIELIRGARDAIFATYGPCAAASMAVIANAVRARVELAPWPPEAKRRILSELASLA